jgi:arginyl-tRNA synthetase
MSARVLTGKPQVAAHMARMAVLVRNVRGPAENALRIYLGSLVPPLAGLPADAVRRCWWRPSPGDFKVVLPRSAGLSEDGLVMAGLVASVMGLDGVVDARKMGPDLYVTMSDSWLNQVVPQAILKQRIGFGSFDIAESACLHVQFSSPNLNKALHVGHLRNHFVGNAVANLLEAAGYTVLKVDAPANWGKHIARALVAYLKWSEGTTPADTRAKGDHFVGSLYSRFSAEAAEPGSTLEEEAAALNVALENGDADLAVLNELVTEWSYGGIRETYHRIGSSFDLVLRERESSDTAKHRILDRIGAGADRRPDGSVYVDQTEQGRRQVTVIRSDGTPLVDVQYLGLTMRRSELQPAFGLVNLMGRDYSERVPELEGVIVGAGFESLVANQRAVYHGLVRLPEGRMRSRDGTGMRADDVLDEVCNRFDRWLAGRSAASDLVRRELADQLGVAFLKFHVLRRPRIDDLVWEEGDLWSETFPRFLRFLRGVARAEVAAWRSIGDRPDSDAGREAEEDFSGIDGRALLLLNDFPFAVARAIQQDEPKLVLQVLEDLASRVGTAFHSQAVARAHTVVFRRGLQLLNIRLPQVVELLGVV